ncbi:MAG TPA: class I SAM-dependent methyltransferase [Xanthobacteraceae bacterium]|nr:class I SAM-dependent methyltransferase [Xanthobacteraceae bacterium]
MSLDAEPANGVSLRVYIMMRRAAAAVFRIPVLGYLARISVGILKLPRLNFHLRRLDQEAQGDRGRIGRIESRLAAIESALPVLESALPPLVEAFPRLVETASSCQTAVRMLRREQQRWSSAAATAPADPISGPRIWLDPQIELVPERELRRDTQPGLNRMPRLSDWAVDGVLSKRMAELREPHVIHRKMWEYAICIEGLQQLGVVTPEATGLAVGAGSERPLYYFANNIKRMVATDLYDDPQHEGTPLMLSAPASFAPFPYRKDCLQVLRMPGDKLDFDDRSFDFVFCLSSIEHFGSRDTQARAFSEMGRVVRPGGIVCVITELVLNGEPHHEYFRPSEVLEMFLQAPSLKLAGSLDLRLSEALPPLASDPRVPADLVSSPHIVLTDGRVLWTSLSMFLRRV